MLDPASDLRLAPSQPPRDFAALLAGLICQDCGGQSFAWRSDSFTGTDDRAVPLPPRTGATAEDEERWLWRQVENGERTRNEAPAAPTPEQIAAARRAVAIATANQYKVDAQVGAIETALSRPGSWLRPGHRLALSGSLRRGRAAMVAASANRERAEREYTAMEREATVRRDYLAAHRRLLDAADDARRELDRRIDEIIDGYAKSPDPPAWFRFGLGYPPRAEAYPQWLAKARAAVAYRRRHGIDHPLEPTGP